MTLDTEDQRKILLSLIDQAAFPGSFAKEVVKLQVAISSAVVVSQQELDDGVAGKLDPAD